MNNAITLNAAEAVTVLSPKTAGISAQNNAVISVPRSLTLEISDEVTFANNTDEPRRMIVERRIAAKLSLNPAFATRSPFFL